MIQFSAADPFPLVDVGQHSQKELRAHSAAVDAWLGLKTDTVEKALFDLGCRNGAPQSSGELQQLWLGLETQALLTPYIEMRWLLERLSLKAGDRVVDMGAAYGRMAFVLNRHFRRVEFVGYEYVGERIREGKAAFKKHGLRNAQLEHVDLASKSFAPVAAKVYFIYDYGSEKALDKSLHDLRKISLEHPITLVVRGRHCRYLIGKRHPWLANANPRESQGMASIYCSDSQLEGLTGLGIGGINSF
jgi:hypothetical protein